jgi:hypothetical protein
VWREQVQRLCTDSEFNRPASHDALDIAEETLRIELPTELRTLLLESDGVKGEYGLRLVWPLDRIVADNIAFRSNADFRRLYMPFDHLLFFADAGNGDQFGFSILDNEIRRSDVYVWNHENDSRTWVAPTRGKYLQWWLTGAIKM